MLGFQRIWSSLCIAAYACLLPVMAVALNVDTPLSNPEDEARARALFYEIRCVVCQSEPIADSPADVASDMRRLVREQVSQGVSDEQIKAYLVLRYGDAILMQPPLKAATGLLWFGPALILLLGLGMAALYFRKSSKAANS